MNLEEKLIKIIKNEEWLMDILKAARSLNLPNWYIGAGTIRNTVWDILSFGKIIHNLSDIDLVYCNAKDTSEETDRQYTENITKLMPEHDFEIVNQARSIMGKVPNKSTEAGLSSWVETATTVAVRLEQDDSFKIFFAETGLQDLFDMIVRPTKSANMTDFNKRYTTKKWLEQWPKLRIVEAK